jgi:hypothetical protein
MLFFAFLLCAIAPASPAELQDFTSDGCSLFPDGSMKDRAEWCDCCLEHDIAYWQGGTKSERLRADKKLRDCVMKRTGSKALAAMMYDGVRAGGHPAFPAWYRWGYGWKYGMGYRSPTEQEKEQARAKLDAYYGNHPSGYCREKHGHVPGKDPGAPGFR